MESLLGGLGGAAAGMTVSAAHKHMLQAQPSLRDPSKGTSLYLCVRAVRVCVCAHAYSDISPTWTPGEQRNCLY